MADQALFRRKPSGRLQRPMKMLPASLRAANNKDGRDRGLGLWCRLSLRQAISGAHPGLLRMTLSRHQPLHEGEITHGAYHPAM